MIGTAALLTRRVAGLPDGLVRGFAVLALLVLAVAATVAHAAPARAVTMAGPACAIGSPSVTFLSGARDATPEAGRPVLDRTDLCPADLEILTELGLPRAPAEAPRLRHILSASFRHTADRVPLCAAGGALHRPPRAA